MPTVSANLTEIWEKRIGFAKKLAIWAIFLGVLYLLRHFFTPIFLTFILCFAGTTAVDALSGRLGWPRRLVAILLTLAFVALLSFVFYFISTSFYEQANRFTKDLPQWSERVEGWLVRLQESNPSMAKVIIRALEHRPPEGRFGAPPVDGATPLKPAEIRRILDANVQRLGGLVFNAAVVLSGLLGSLVLAVVFSFLIVLDLPRVRRDTQKLKDSRLGFVYNETSQTVVAFGEVVGRTFQAQAVIACINTILTFVGLYMLGIPKLAFLLVVVFLFSFIPIAGVFISSTPIVLVALNAETGGIAVAIACVAVITIIHCIEAYILNPRIMGHHLHINPVFVLLILIIGGHLVGVWGVLLGLPIAAYVYHTVRPEAAEQAKAKRDKKRTGEPDAPPEADA